jgi:hypothetical protein
MNDNDSLRLLAEFRDLQHLAVRRQKVLVIMTIWLAVLGTIFCAAFLAEIFVVITGFLQMQSR